MTMTQGRPRVFVSSTVFDFRDLRSALKFWLDELGYDVMLSEANDFVKPLDENSFNACLQAIDSCQHFILLIGSRVGGFFDAANRISITRMEYRRAYERLNAGQLQVISFVRREVWNVRDDRKALSAVLREDFVKTGEERRRSQTATEPASLARRFHSAVGRFLSRSNRLDAAKAVELANHDSKFVTDAEATFSFIEEITRTTEMKEAMKKGRGFPKGNWVHTFETFEDIVQALRPALGITSNMRRRGLEANLRREIVENLRRLVNRKKGHIRLEWSELFGVLGKISIAGDILGNTDIDAATMNSLIVGMSSPRFDSTFLDEALRSGEFLEYDPVERAFRAGDAQGSLINLRDAIEAMRSVAASSERQKLLSDYLRQGDPKQFVKVKNLDLINVFAFWNRYEAIVNALWNALRVVSGAASIPTKDPNDLVAAFRVPTLESASVDDVESWAKEYKPRT